MQLERRVTPTELWIWLGSLGKREEMKLGVTIPRIWDHQDRAFVLF